MSGTFGTHFGQPYTAQGKLSLDRKRVPAITSLARCLLMNISPLGIVESSGNGGRVITEGGYLEGYGGVVSR